MIRFIDISHSYRSAGVPVPALRHVTFDVGEGEHVAVLGANGSGKSTLVRLTNGLLLPDEGSVTVDGIGTSDRARAYELRQRVGMVFQRPDDQIVTTSVEDDVAFGPENLGLPREEIRQRVDAAIAAVGLAGLEGREPHLLSGGQKQRLAIAGALAMRPAYLVLDEPVSMLDPEGRAGVLGIIDALRASGTGIVHVTHDLADVLGADRAVVLDRGEVRFDGGLEELFSHAELLDACGLELPPLSRLAAGLRALGAPVPALARSAEAVVEALWH